MSRLYMWIDTDAIEIKKMARGNQRMDIKINYGTKDNSKRFLSLSVRFPIGADKPVFQLVDITTGKTYSNEGMKNEG